MALVPSTSVDLPFGLTVELPFDVTGLLVFHALMTVSLLAVTGLAVWRFVPILVETDGTDVSEGVAYWLRLGTLAGGLFAAAGFGALAVGEAFPGAPTGVVALLGFLVGGPLFCLAFGALAALVIRVRYIKPDEA